MNPKLIFARWIASRIETRTRRQRRSLRDYQRLETARIHTGEKRSRGLRLYVAWSRRHQAAIHGRHVRGWHEIPLPQAA